MISVVMATFNRAATLPRAIESVRRQTFEDWELIVVDDGSTDETAAVLAGLDDARIRVVRHPVNRGVTAAKNTGLDLIRGEWFTTLDSDDEVMPEAFAAMLECAARSGADAITCECLDSVTGQLTGAGPGHDCRLSPKEAGRLNGDFWGLTATHLLGDLRFDERLPGYEATVFLRINRRARRYYLHKALLTYHTEGADRVRRAGHAASLRRKATVFSTLGEDKGYLRELRSVNPREYCHTMVRVCVARLLQPILESVHPGVGHLGRRRA